MPFGLVNPIDTPYGQFLYNCPYPRKPLCSVPFGHIARGSGQLSSSKKASVLCSLWTHRTGVRTTVLIQESLSALFPLDTSHRGQDNLTEARTDARSIMSLSGSIVCSSFHLYPLN
ncbi:hypothetical protein AVEN_135282-1 [Araneus ventricosus]|uniref:Uncharacterized protein n=1 Tax=Araneus ventricosus TaxID=182803 RepID=A0A4Y2CP35_ARAVE|nr:hypothetical protein AVEN_135282-1 [Araneus ventricosus]